jgi:hypothetical protein
MDQHPMRSGLRSSDEKPGNWGMQPCQAAYFSSDHQPPADFKAGFCGRLDHWLVYRQWLHHEAD